MGAGFVASVLSGLVMHRESNCVSGLKAYSSLLWNTTYGLLGVARNIGGTL